MGTVAEETPDQIRVSKQVSQIVAVFPEGSVISSPRPVLHGANDLVSPASSGEPIGKHLVVVIIKQRYVWTVSDSIRIRDLSNTSATLLMSAGVHIKVVSERLGHSNTNITMNLYSHVTKTLQEDAATKIGHMLQRSP